MSDEGKAGVAVAIWASAFSAGLIIADHTKLLGFMIMITATIIFIICLWADRKIENEKRASKKLLGKYRADAARRAEEAHSECTKFIGNLQRVHNK